MANIDVRGYVDLKRVNRESTTKTGKEKLEFGFSEPCGRTAEGKTEYNKFTIVAWKHRVDNLEVVKDGAYLEVSGLLKVNSYKTVDGVWKTAVEIVASKLSVPPREKKADDSGKLPF